MAVKIVNDTSDPFLPNVRLVQVASEMRGLATDSNDINANGMLDQNEVMWGNTVGPRNEDANMNGVADAGEDLNGNGKLDRDLGLKSIELGLGSSNLELEVSPFSIGDIAVPFVIRRVDSSKDGLGTVLITDVSGNVTSAPIGLVSSTIIRNVHVKETLARGNIELDRRSFTTPPTELHEYPDRYEIEWFYPVASALSDLDLSYEVTFINPAPGETRVVGRQLVLEYEDAGGSPVSYVIGPQSVEVLRTALEMTAVLDKARYMVGESASLLVTLKNLGLVKLHGGGPVCVQLRDKEGVPLGGWKSLTVGAMNAGDVMSLTPLFDLSSYMIGSYDMHVVLAAGVCGADGAYKTIVVPFEVADKPGTVSVSSGLKLDGVFYQSSDRVLADTTVHNQLTRGMADGYSMRVQIVRPDSTIMSPQTKPVPNLVPLNQWAETYRFRLKNEVPGVYTVVSQLLDRNSNVVETRSSKFSVLPSSQTGFGLTGVPDAAPVSVPAGAPVLLTGAIHNRGNESLAGLPLTLHVINSSTDEEVVHFDLNAPALAVGAKHEFEQNWPTTGRVGDVYLAVLSVAVGTERLALASSSFALAAAKVCNTPQLGSIKPVLNAPLQTVVSSEALVVSGMGGECEAPIRVSEGSYSINNGPFTAATSTVKDGDRVVVRMQTPGDPSASASLTVTIGSVSRAFSVTTQAQPGTCGRANTIRFEPLRKQPRGRNVLSNSVVVGGLGAGCSVIASVQGGYIKVVRAGRLVALAAKVSARTVNIAASDRIPPGFSKGSVTVQDGDEITLLQKTSALASAESSIALVLADSIVPWVVSTAESDTNEPQPVPTLNELALILLALLLGVSGFALRPMRY
ncbi:MAG: IPTL-CTERM sorting domain-containing protein [Uliginosibacterium sp.]|nr:IPTL-CTERM sorting domain-containing protein [Uliginosibacterium sp.]